MSTEATTPRPTEQPSEEQTCQHDWQYNTDTHRHECAKCHMPAPPDWNEVLF